MYQVIRNYRDNVALRKSFNELASETFDLDFEDWYQNGYWGDNYNPYSICIGDKIVANVSVNHINMLIDGTIKHFLQLGTVMTSKSYQNRGFIRQIMEEIDRDYSGNVDGMFLFANDNVLDFYPKFGFKKSIEYIYSKKVINNDECQLKQTLMNSPSNWKQLENAIDQNIFCGKLDMVQNPELIMFYVTKFMQENIYYHEKSDTYIIAEIENNHVFIHNIFSSTITNPEDVYPLFGKDISSITLGFTPINTENYEMNELKEEDCTFFIKGNSLLMIEEKKMRIPSLAHA